jgi:hypothetical protein
VAGRRGNYYLAMSVIIVVIRRLDLASFHDFPPIHSALLIVPLSICLVGWIDVVRNHVFLVQCAEVHGDMAARVGSPTLAVPARWPVR